MRWNPDAMPMEWRLILYNECYLVGGPRDGVMLCPGKLVKTFTHPRNEKLSWSLIECDPRSANHIVKEVYKYSHATFHTQDRQKYKLPPVESWQRFYEYVSP